MSMEEQEPKKVTIEVELDATAKEVAPNKFQSVIDLAKAVDTWRIFPRVFISMYIYLLYEVTVWFMGLSNPNTQQAGLVSVVVGAGAAWFGLYTGSSKKFDGPAPTATKK